VNIKIYVHQLNEERFLLHAQADEAPFNDILVDIRVESYRCTAGYGCGASTRS
jgi:hypothetical protein